MNRTYGEAKELLINEFFEEFILPLGDKIDEIEIEHSIEEWLRTRWRKAKDRFEHYWLTENSMELSIEIINKVREYYFSMTGKPLTPKLPW